MNRRSALTAGVTAALTASLSAAEDLAAAPAMGNRVHLCVRPEWKEKLSFCLGSVLGCGKPVILAAAGMTEAMLAFRFPGGGSISVEFTPEALDEKQARYGAWLEITSGDPAATKQKVLDAVLPQVHHPATNTFYFQLPGGQIVGIVSLNPAAGEMKVR